MVDNVTADAGSGGAVFATDDVSSVHYPITKITIGAMDSAGTVLTGGTGTVDAGCLRVALATDAATVTANLSATDNAVLDTINTAVVATQAAVEGTLTVGSHAVTNAGTFAVQSTLQAGTAEIGKLAAGIAEIGNVKNSGTFAVQIDAGAVTSLALLDDVIFVDDTATHTAATTKAIGIGAVAVPTDTAIDANDIGMVAMSLDRRLHVDADVTASVALDVSAATVTVDLGANNDVTLATLPDTAASDLASMSADLGTIDTDTGNIAAGFATEGSALGSGVLLQGDDGTDRTNVLVDAAGHLQVDVLTGGGSGTEYTEDAAAAANPVGGALILVREDARAGSLTTTDGDNVAARGNNKGELYTIDTDGNALLTTIDADTSTIAGDTTSMVSLLTTIDADTGFLGDIRTALEIIDDVIFVDDGDWSATLSKHALIGGVYQASPGSITDGDTGPLRLNVNGAAHVAVQGSATVAGDVANDGMDSGNPVKIGAKATNSVEGLTQVATNDRTDIRADLNGCLITRPHTTLEEIITEQVSNTNGTSTAFTNFPAGGAAVHNYLTTIAVYNSSATNGYIDLRDGTGGAIVFTIPLPTVGGSIINLPVPLKFAANTAIAYDVSGALSTVYISVVGFQAQG